LGALTPEQQITTIVFGDTFSLYSDDEFEEFIGFLKTRLERNGIELHDEFAGKRCLDAGCGGGRATIMMAQAGAREVVAFDLSRTNVETTRMRAEQRGLDNVVAEEGSLLALPFEDESFDVVWSNGVLHHTGDTDGSLKEIARVLRPGGWMWLYLYGSGGIYWRVVDWVRETLRDVDVSACIAQLRLQNVPVRRIAEWIDDWFVPVLQRYTVEDVRRRLVELGFAEAGALAQGTHYDTSQRRVGASAREIELMGDGDVRFWCQKTARPSGTDGA
jgi:ubiquinone/menaquinone biosynthesis C-methylase UbiE